MQSGSLFVGTKLRFVITHCASYRGSGVEIRDIRRLVTARDISMRFCSSKLLGLESSSAELNERGGN